MPPEKLQRDLFLESEGDEWFRRNRGTFERILGGEDRVLGALEAAALRPRRVLEIGCANGFRLSRLAARLGAECHGIDPSGQAVAEGRARWPGLSLRVGTADRLDYPDEHFDLVVFGFCLYLCDRNLLFRIACEADRCLGEGGTVAVSDFCPPFPYRNRNSQREGLYSYKLDHSRMFSWNPAYTETYRRLHGHPEHGETPDTLEAVVLLRKSTAGAYPVEPFGPRERG